MSGDAAQAARFLTWARKNGHDVSCVSVGTCRVELRQPVAKPVDRKEPQRDMPEAIYARFGGEVYREAVEERGELVPAVGRR